MTKQEYELIRTAVMSDCTLGEGNFRFELLKALWDLTKAVKGGLDD